MPGSQLAACIYTTNGAPVASPSPARARTHAAHPLISTRRGEVAETGERRRRERRRGQPFCWSGPPWQEQHTRSRLCCCCRMQLRGYKLICFGKFAAAFTQKVTYERKSQSRARTITEMIKFNANALENMSKRCLFHCKFKIFGAIYLNILSNMTCF